MAQSSRPSVVRRHRLSRWPRGTRQCQGVSLTELLIGMVISIVVLGAAVRVLVSLIRSDTASQVELNRKDELSRVLGLMQDEIRNALRVESGASLTALAGCPTAPQLILRASTANEDISYGLKAQARNATWRGPAVLVRCGPNYNVDGSLNAGTVATPIRSEQEVLDGLCTTTAPGCNAQSGFPAPTVLGGTGAISRSVELTLISSASGTSITSVLQVPINSNQVYGLLSSGASTCPDGTGSISTGCADPNGEAVHYRPILGAASIAGTPNMEDIFYFEGNRADYTLSRTPGSGSCTNEQCTVRQGSGGNSITFTDGDVLVFRDAQIRL